MRTKLLPHHLSANTNPKFFNLTTILPDNFLTITDFPPMLNSPQLMFLGHANLRKIERVLISAHHLLEEESGLIQKEVDDLDSLDAKCIQTMAQNSGCTYSPVQNANFSPSPSTYTCQFGQHVAALCKSQGKIRLGSAETAPYILAKDTENRLDDYIGELIGLINRYEDFINKLNIYISRVHTASNEIGFSRPIFLRWRPREYPRIGDRVIHFMIKKVDGQIQTRKHDAICIRFNRNPDNRFPIIVCEDLANHKEFSVEHNNRLMTYHDYNLLRGDSAYALIWLENYTWPTRNDEEAKILAALKAAFTKLLLDR